MSSSTAGIGLTTNIGEITTVATPNDQILFTNNIDNAYSIISLHGTQNVFTSGMTIRHQVFEQFSNTWVTNVSFDVEAVGGFGGPYTFFYKTNSDLLAHAKSGKLSADVQNILTVYSSLPSTHPCIVIPTKVSFRERLVFARNAAGDTFNFLEERYYS